MDDLIQDAAAHVQDAEGFHLPEFLGGHVHLGVEDMFGVEGFNLTKYMTIELAAAVLMIIIFVPLAWKVRSGRPLKGRFWNFWETILLFVRDEIVRPAIGHKEEADKFLPFLWNMFFFVLFCNLFGMLPWAGSPTGSLGVTAVLAGLTFLTVVFAGTMKYGALGFWVGLVPHMDLPLLLAVFLKPMLLVIEVVGLLIKHAVLAIRLFANMFAGHLVLGVIIGFIGVTAEMHWGLWAGVTVASVLGSAVFSILEIFVAFLQAYIFLLLSALFIGMAIHQH